MLRGAVLKSFPPSLSADEEQYYLQKYIEGDLEAKHILIERNLRLVAHVIKKYQHLEENPEDLISIGTIGLIKAIITFNPDKNNRLGTYAADRGERAETIQLRLRCKAEQIERVFTHIQMGIQRGGLSDRRQRTQCACSGEAKKPDSAAFDYGGIRFGVR